MSKTKAKKCYETVEWMQNRPVEFLSKTTGEHYWSKERQILNALQEHNDITVRSCHGSGKTFTAARAALWFFLAHKDSIVLSTAPTFNQVKNQLWRELHTAVNSCKVPIPKTNQTGLEADNEWYALGLSTNDTDHFQGFHQDYILAIIDEASGVSEEIFDAVDGVLTSMHAKRLYIGNPLRRSGEFFRSHQDEDYERIHISVFDLPNFTEFGITEDDILNNNWKKKVDGPMPYPELTTPAWAYKFQKKHPKGSMGYTIKILGEFPESEEDTFIVLSLAEQGVQADLEAEGPKQLGVDPARFGSDQTGFCLRQGPKVLNMWQRPLTDEMEIAGEVNRMLKDDHEISTVKMDTIGPGAGAFDRVKEVVDEAAVLDVDLVEVKGSEKPDSAEDEDEYYNKVAALWGKIKTRLQNGQIDLPDDEELKSQLSTRKYSYRSNGKIQLESKDDMKARGLDSPDKADALTYAYYTPEEQSRRQAHEMY